MKFSELEDRLVSSRNRLLYRCDADGNLQSTNEPAESEGEPAPAFYIPRGNVLVPDSVRIDLENRSVLERHFGYRYRNWASLALAKSLGMIE